MADITGTIQVRDGAVQYPARLTMRGFATLQAEFGKDWLTRLQAVTTAGDIDFALAVRGIELAISAANPSLPPDQVAAITDRVGTVTLFAALVAAAFPDEQEKAAPASGNGKGPRRAA
jgi:hypothetical protein